MKKSLSLQELSVELGKLMKDYISRGYRFFYIDIKNPNRGISLDGIEISRKGLSFKSNKILIPMQGGYAVYVSDRETRNKIYSVFSGNNSEGYTMNVFPRGETLVYIPNIARELIPGMTYIPYSSNTSDIGTLVEANKTQNQVFIKIATIESLCKGNPLYKEITFNPEDPISGFYKILL